MICVQRHSSTWSTAEQGRSTLFFVLRVRFQLTASISSPWRPRSREDEEVIGDHPEADPALHPIETPIPTPPEAMPALHHTDSPFTSGPPPQGPAKPTLPGLVLNDTSLVQFSGCNDQDCLSGNPKLQQNPAAGEDSTYFDYGDIGWEELVARASKTVSGTINGLGPVVSGSTCVTTSLSNWGDAENGGVCKGYYPIVYSPGNLNITGGYGQGILLVEGDLAVQGGMRFYGPVIVKGKLSTAGTGGHFNGGVLAANVDLEQNSVLGNAVIQYSSCAIENALLGVSLPKRVVQRAWADLY